MHGVIQTTWTECRRSLVNCMQSASLYVYCCCPTCTDDSFTQHHPMPLSRIHLGDAAMLVIRGL